jgi:hypothetical protein
MPKIYPPPFNFQTRLEKCKRRRRKQPPTLFPLTDFLFKKKIKRGKILFRNWFFYLTKLSPCRREIRCVGLLSSSHLTRLAPISRFVLLFVCCLILFIFFNTKLLKRFIISFPRNRRAAPCRFLVRWRRKPAAAIIYYLVHIVLDFSGHSPQHFPPTWQLAIFCVCRFYAVRPAFVSLSNEPSL